MWIFETWRPGLARQAVLPTEVGACDEVAVLHDALDQFTGAQPRRAGEIEHEAKPLRRSRLAGSDATLAAPRTLMPAYGSAST